MISTAELVGRWEPPHAMPAAQRWVLGLTALRGWVGKDVVDGEHAWNLVRRGGTERRVLPMHVSQEPSWTDGEPVVVLSYPPDAPRPFRWMRDELRWSAPGAELAGQTFLLVGARRFGPTPFRLRRA